MVHELCVSSVYTLVRALATKPQHMFAMLEVQKRFQVLQQVTCIFALLYMHVVQQNVNANELQKIGDSQYSLTRAYLVRLV
jgi:hypothetical protein